MAVIQYPGSSLIIGDTDEIPLREDDPRLNDSLVDEALKGMILSSSGWRGVFAAGGNGESPEPGISAAHKVIVAAGAKVFADYLKQVTRRENPIIIVGMDTRPTGNALANVMIRVFLFQGCDVRFAFIVAAPEIMAYARSLGAAGTAEAGFAYISASHNPIGHNGLKFGLSDGGVLPASETAVLIENFRSFMASPDRIALTIAMTARTDPRVLGGVYSRAPETKKEARRAYLEFTGEVVSGLRDKSRRETVFDAIRRGLKEYPLGIAADFNGSARTMSLDREFFSSLGLRFHAINDKPGEIVHRIVPEGESLEPCRLFLEELHRQDPSVIMGYTPDCDGDRGNLVIWDEAEKRARSLEAQEVFALACVAELAYLVWTGELSYDNKGNALNKAALAVNGPTSMRIDRIAKAFDVSVFRAEVGEANVVGLARKLRERGYLVRILGEGAAGGAIIHPSAVRDPIDMAAALLKLLTLRSRNNEMGLFELWCDLSDQAETYRADFSLSDIIATLPAFVSTGSYTADALLRIKTGDHGSLKNRYQDIFLQEWEERKDQFKARYGISGWEATAYVGMEEKRGIARFGEAGQGGLKISFVNEQGRKIACIWMRGSGTEPVFRVMADAEGSDKRMERDLIEWQRRMVTKADEALSV
jgi:phosphoglucomutase